MEIGVKVLAEDPVKNTVQHTCTAFSTCVKVDEHGKPRLIAPFTPVTDVERDAGLKLSRKQHRMQRLKELQMGAYLIK